MTFRAAASAWRLGLAYLTVLAACASPRDTGASSGDGATLVAAQTPDDVTRACAVADSLITALGGSSRNVDARYDFGANFGTEPRGGCEVTFSGFARHGPGISDSVLSFWAREGWRFAPRYQADGIGDNLTGMFRGNALCLINRQLDMSDEGDDGPVMRSDSIDVAISCTRLLPTDTLTEPPTG